MHGDEGGMVIREGKEADGRMGLVWGETAGRSEESPSLLLKFVCQMDQQRQREG